MGNGRDRDTAAEAAGHDARAARSAGRAGGPFQGFGIIGMGGRRDPLPGMTINR